MKYCLLTSQDDADISFIVSVYRLPAIAKFISISEENYWQYVTSNGNVWFYKISENDRLIATIHLELTDKVLYLSIVVFPEYQKTGIATKILKDIQEGKFGIDFDKIQVSIDKNNIASIKLFETAGFICTDKVEELLEYEYVIT